MPDILFPKILVPVDFSPCSEEAFRVALSLARLSQSEVLLLHVIDTKSLQALNALGLACARGLDPDRPRGLSKVTLTR